MLTDKYRAIWEAELDKSQKAKIKKMIENGDSILFFQYQKDIFGASEGSRVIFAKMSDKNDEDNNPDWLDSANFMATNLTKAMEGQQVQMVFGKKDLTDIHVISREYALEQLDKSH